MCFQNQVANISAIYPRTQVSFPATRLVFLNRFKKLATTVKVMFCRALLIESKDKWN